MPANNSFKKIQKHIADWDSLLWIKDVGELEKDVSCVLCVQEQNPGEFVVAIYTPENNYPEDMQDAKDDFFSYARQLSGVNFLSGSVESAGKTEFHFITNLIAKFVDEPQIAETVGA